MGEILAIHSAQKAEALQRVLRANNIPCELTPFVSDDPAMEGVKVVSVDASFLPQALRIAESRDGEDPVSVVKKITGMGNSLLIPVDFSELSLLAVKVGFEFATRLGLRPVLLHSYMLPYPVNIFPVGDAGVSAPEEIAEAESGRTIGENARKAMDRFLVRLADERRAGRLADVECDNLVVEGMPEESIADYCRDVRPALVVMATRGKSNRDKQMMGSVTAEVLDSCRVPVFTVPEDYEFCGVKEITRLAYFCNLDRQDIFSVDALMRMFDYPAVEVWLIPVHDRMPEKIIEKRINALRDYFVSNYPAATFHACRPGENSLRQYCEDVFLRNNLQLIIVPNKKKNIFSRLFNPGIAHKMLFERDMPILALPV